ncbi:MAG: cryptochrome/photolyase family protein [Candidatus Saccharicenans sp.]
MRAVFWFRRDLRLEDNTGLAECLNQAEEIIPVFIFERPLLQQLEGPAERLGFLLDCLKRLDDKLKKKGSRLYCFHGTAEEIFPYLIETGKVEAVFTNTGHSWTGSGTEASVARISREKAIKFFSFNDSLLVEPAEIGARRVFGAFFKAWLKTLSQKPLTLKKEPSRLRTPGTGWPELKDILPDLAPRKNHHWSPDYAERRLQTFDFSSYAERRNRLDEDGTSRLSVAIRFGLISVRQVFSRARKFLPEDSQFVKELAWREFWYHIRYHFPWTEALEFQEKRRGLKWLNREEDILAVEEARTGYPIIDAAINQLKEEGWMHNRARMVVASFVTKDLLIDWRIGEKLFKKYLLDYDEVVNTGNWQWSASVGADPRPFRVFNPQLQAARFDPECRYQKKYLPELKKISCQRIHSLDLPAYHQPIVDHRAATVRARKFYLG